MKKHILYIATIIAGTFIATPVSATTMDTNVNIRPSMTLSVSSNDINLNLNPATKPFDTKDLTITIGTNNPTGYKLYLTSDSTNLINTEDNTKTIETLPSSTPATGYDQSSFPANYWGYRKSNGSSSSGNYLPFNSDLLVSSATGPSNEITTSIGLASKIDYLKESGTYTLDFKLNAIPLVTNYTMQELGTNSTLAQTVCTENPAMVVDSRDNQTYTISKLKDGRCWMTQNLKLGKYTDSLTLTSADSDVGASGFVLDGKITDGKIPTTTVDTPVYYCAEEYGCYYNWYTSVAGSGNSTTDSGDMQYSICPTGWGLPTSGDNSIFYKLAVAYGFNIDSDVIVNAMMLVSPITATENINGESMPGFLLGGRYVVTGGNLVGKYANYWSSTASSDTDKSYGLALGIDDNEKVDPAHEYVKYGARSVRCLLKQS